MKNYRMAFVPVVLAVSLAEASSSPPKSIQAVRSEYAALGPSGPEFLHAMLTNAKRDAYAKQATDASVLLFLGHELYALGDRLQAESAFQLVENNSTATSFQIADSYRMLGMISDFERDDASAAQFYGRSLAVLDADSSLPPGRSPITYMVQTRLAESLGRLGDHEAVFPLREQLAATARQRRNSRDLWVHRFAQARSLAILGRHEQARAIYMEAIGDLPDGEESSARAAFGLTELARRSFGKDDAANAVVFMKSALDHSVFSDNETPYEFVIYAEAFAFIEHSEQPVPGGDAAAIEFRSLALLSSIDEAAFRRAGPDAIYLRQAAIDTAVILAERFHEQGDPELAAALIGVAQQIPQGLPELVEYYQQSVHKLPDGVFGPDGASVDASSSER
jgi:tetratricopeptide (TPR) repeat protein